jgi:hypothetical protein
MSPQYSPYQLLTAQGSSKSTSHAFLRFMKSKRPANRTTSVSSAADRKRRRWQQVLLCLFPRSGFDHPQTCSAQVKEKVELYLYSRCSTLNVFIFIWIHVPHGQVSAEHRYFIHTPVNTIWHSHKHINHTNTSTTRKTLSSNELPGITAFLHLHVPACLSPV